MNSRIHRADQVVDGLAKSYGALPLWIAVAASVSHAPWQSMGNLGSYGSDGSGITPRSGNALIHLVAMNPDLIRIRVATKEVQ